MRKINGTELEKWQQMTRTLIAQNPGIKNADIIAFFKMHEGRFEHLPTCSEIDSERQIIDAVNVEEYTEEFYELTFVCEVPRNVGTMKVVDLAWSFLPCHGLREIMQANGLDVDGISFTVGTKTRRRTRAAGVKSDG